MLVQPRPVRRHALRPARRATGASAPRRSWPPTREAGLRPRGQAPHHPGHLRAVGGLLRRLLRPGAEGPHADQRATSTRRSARPTCWSRRRRRPPRSRSARRSTTRWPCTSTTWPPSPTNLAGTAAMSVPSGPRRRRAAGRAADHGARAGRGRMYRVAAAFEAARNAEAGGPLIAASRRSRDDARPTDDWWTTTRSSRSSTRCSGLEVHVELGTADQDVLRLPDRVRRRAEHPGLPDLPGPARSLPVVNRSARRVRDPHRPGAELRDRAVVPVRAEELLLPGHAEELPDLAVRRADRLRRLPRRRRSTTGETFRVEIERAHMEEDTGKSLHVGGATGRIHGAEYSLLDYNRAGVPLIEIVTKPIAGTGERAPEVARAYVDGAARAAQARSASPTCGWTRARCAATRTCRWPRATPGARHPHARPRTSTRCARSSGRSATRSPRQAARAARRRRRIIQETRHFHEDDRHHRVRAAPRRPPRTTATSPSPTWCRSRPTAEWVEELRGTLPELPWVRRARLQQRVGLHDEEHARPGQRRRGRPDRGRPSRPARRPAEARIVVDRVPGPAGQRPRASRSTSCRSPRRRSPGSSRWSPPAS